MKETNSNLVGGFNPSEKYESFGIIIPISIYGKINKIDVRSPAIKRGKIENPINEVSSWESHL